MQMSKKESSREKVWKKEDHYKNQLRQIVMREKEADSRAFQIEDEQNKLEIFVTQLQEEKKILKLMVAQREEAFSKKS